MDEDTRTQLAIIAQQARAISEALSKSKTDRLEADDHTHHNFNNLLGRAKELLGDSPTAKLLPSGVQPRGYRSGPGRLDIMTAAGQLATALETLLAHEPGRLEQLEKEKEELEARVREAEARTVTILDDELRDRCVDLLLRPGKADTAVGAACTVLENRIRKLAGLPPELIGVALVDQALRKREGELILRDIEAEQEGFHLLNRGVIGFCKNPTSHRLDPDYDLTRARQVVGLIDALLSWLRETKKRDPQAGGST